MRRVRPFGAELELATIEGLAPFALAKIRKLLMAILPAGETFPRPTVKQVIFQIRFPKLFFLQTKVGDLQLDLMSRFPKSESVARRALVFAQGSEENLQNLLKDRAGDDSERIWIFENDEGVKIEIKLDALTVVSESHKSYRHTPNSFRSALTFILSAFLKHVPIQTVQRVGFRYVDECPFPSRTNACFTNYFNSCLPVTRFTLDECSEMVCRIVRRREHGSIRYAEAILERQPNSMLQIDMDAFAENVPASDVMATADRLHDIVRQEFESTVNDPVIRYMRTGELEP